MRGRIYTEQKCSKCGGKLVHDENRRGLFCNKHNDQYATGKFIIRFGRDVTKRARTFFEAERILNGLRYKVDEGTFDARDYKKDSPLGFETLARKWLSVKERDVKRKSYNNLRNYMERAITEWGRTNIKNIGYGEIEDFIFTQEVSDKTRANIKSCLHTFWTWLRKRRLLTPSQVPEFPEVHYELGWRRTVDRTTQQTIIGEVYEISKHVNIKIYIGIKWLATYIAIRPGELINIQEKHIDTDSGYIFIPHPKEKKLKSVPIATNDIELIKSLPRGLPELHFFRHSTGLSGVTAGEKFGPRYLYKWWKRACSNLGIEGVDLYGGTRHSSAIALGKYFTPEQIKQATMHSTNKAFERYYRTPVGEVRAVYEWLGQGEQREQHSYNERGSNKICKVLKLIK